MEKRFCSKLKKELKIANQTPIVIAFSGGMDSVCLLNLFWKYNKNLIVAHFNHSLRDTAERDEIFSRKTAQELKLPFVTEKADVTSYANEKRLSIEEAARKLRYEFLYRVAQGYGSEYIAVGHHADDQVETVFMHLFRGSGLSGLSGMREISIIHEFSPHVKIIRPLLTFWRTEIEKYCEEKKLSFVVDETNALNIYQRNRLRNETIPALNQLYNKLNQRILNMAEIIQKEDDFFDDQTSRILDLVCDRIEKDFIQLNKKELSKQPLAIQRRLIRKVAIILKPDLRDLSFENVENLLQFVSVEKPGEIDLQENLYSIIDNDEIIIADKKSRWIDTLYPQVYEEFRVNADQIRIFEFPSNWYLELDFCTKTEINTLNQESPYQAYFDAEKIGLFIFIRNRIPGDKFQPLGMTNGTMKISDFFVNFKLLKVARDHWPLILNSKKKIAWVPGFRQDHAFRVTDQTSKIMKMSMRRK